VTIRERRRRPCAFAPRNSSREIESGCREIEEEANIDALRGPRSAIYIYIYLYIYIYIRRAIAGAHHSLDSPIHPRSRCRPVANHAGTIANRPSYGLSLGFPFVIGTEMAESCRRLVVAGWPADLNDDQARAFHRADVSICPICFEVGVARTEESTAGVSEKREEAARGGEGNAGAPRLRERKRGRGGERWE